MAVDVKITVTGEERLADAFGLFGRRVSDLRPYWGQAAGVFFKHAQQTFDTQGFGSWRPLSPRYAAWKRQHYPSTLILERTGDLRRSLVSRSTPNSIYREAPLSLELGTTVRYARYHQTGTSRMPARPPLIVTPELEQGIGAVIQLGLGRYASDLGFQVRT